MRRPKNLKVSGNETLRVIRHLEPIDSLSPCKGPKSYNQKLDLQRALMRLVPGYR